MIDELLLFKNKKVFITGHTGFKGSWLSYILVQVGAIVKGYSLSPITQPNHFDLLNLEGKTQTVYGDIRDKKKLHAELSSFEPEFVFHLAAQALVKESYVNPVENFETNIIGSVNLLDAVRKVFSVRVLIFITSDKCYENQEWIWGYRETDTLGGHDPYSASKAGAEIAFSAFSRSYFQFKDHFGYASVRAGNVIGGGDWSKDRIIPDCIRAISSGKPIILRNPNATRPWQHVLEPISGYLKIAIALYNDHKNFCGSWNFGPLSSEVRTVLEVANSIIKNMKSGTVQIEENESNLHEANLLQLNCDKANQLLKWFPRWSVEKTLEYTAYWYRRYSEGEAVENITMSQILNYFGIDYD